MKDPQTMTDRELLIRIDERTNRNTKDIAAITKRMDCDNTEITQHGKDIEMLKERSRIPIWMKGMVGAGGIGAVTGLYALLKSIVNGN